jgi:hypothetical protein
VDIVGMRGGGGHLDLIRNRDVWCLWIAGQRKIRVAPEEGKGYLSATDCFRF